MPFRSSPANKSITLVPETVPRASSVNRAWYAASAAGVASVTYADVLPLRETARPHRPAVATAGPTASCADPVAPDQWLVDPDSNPSAKIASAGVTVSTPCVTAPQFPAVSRARTDTRSSPGDLPAVETLPVTVSDVASNRPSAALIDVPEPCPGSAPTNHSAALRADPPPPASEAVDVTVTVAAPRLGSGLAMSPRAGGPVRSITNVDEERGPQLPDASRPRTSTRCGPALRDASFAIGIVPVTVTAGVPNAPVIGWPEPAAPAASTHHSAAVTADPPVARSSRTAPITTPAAPFVTDGSTTGAPASGPELSPGVGVGVGAAVGVEVGAAVGVAVGAVVGEGLGEGLAVRRW